nr:hypothetical protein [Krasilnikovia cinnamomea]
MVDDQDAALLTRLASLRQHQQGGRRSPHKPLLVLLALGQLATAGSSELPWSQAQARLSDLIAEFGPSSRTSRAQSAAYPFTRLRSDGYVTASDGKQSAAAQLGVTSHPAEAAGPAEIAGFNRGQ